MNEDQVTTLLDNLGRDIEVSPAPVVAATEDGRRRLRWRHRAQVGGAAAAVLALAGGSLVLQQQLVADGQTTNQAPAVAPTIDALVGEWTPTMLADNPKPPEGPTAKPIAFAFARGTGGPIWSGNDGCYRVGGSFQLDQDGTFQAIVRYTKATACLGVQGSLPFSGVSAVMNARHLEIISGQLRLTSASGTRLGVFVPYNPTELPPGPAWVSGRVPTKLDLLGAWRPAQLGQGPWAAVPDLYPGQWLAFDIHSGGLRWHGEDGCNSVSGKARLGAAGSFSTSGFTSTLALCIGPGGKPPYTEVNVMLDATQVRLVGQGLAFYHGDTRLGLFVQGSQPQCCPATGR